MIASEDFNALSVDQLRARGGAKWNTFPQDVVPAWVAETDYPVAEPIMRALHEAIDRGVMGYPTEVQPELQCVVEQYLSTHYRMPVFAEHMRVVPDDMTGFSLALTTFCEPDAGVVVLTPSYAATLLTTRGLGYQVYEVPMLSDDGVMVPDFAGVRRAFMAGARTLALIQPHNPTGRMFTVAELTRFSEIVAEFDGRVISDEIFAPVTWTPHVSYAAVNAETAEHGISLVSAVKGWGVPGLRCAFMLAHNADDASILDDQVPYWRTLGASTLGMVASQAAYREGEPWRRAMAEHTRSQAVYLETELARLHPELGWKAPDATFLAWLDLRSYGLGANAAAHLRNHGLAVVSGPNHGKGYEGFVRLNFGTTRVILDEIISRLDAALCATR